MNRLLVDWMREWKIDEDLLWKKAAIDQACFMRDIVCQDLLKVHCFIVSTHVSKSVLLPVYGFVMRNGIKVISRYNFYDWKLSVKLPGSLPNNYLPTEVMSGGVKGQIPSYYLEGFSEKWSYGPYEPENPKCRKFTIEVGNRYQVYTLLFLLKNAFPEKDFSLKKYSESVDDIISVIDKIFHDNGRYKTFVDGSITRTQTHGWEIFEKTVRNIEDVIKEKTGKHTFIMDEADDKEELAKLIYQNPESLPTFMMEKWCYETGF